MFGVLKFLKEIKIIAKKWGKKTKWLARYANVCAIPPGKHPSRVQVHDVCF
jgi:hypothetical protein